VQKRIWLVYPKKASGKPGISYNDSVEEALCFGWIDSTIKTLDKDHVMRRFTPRNPKSPYSQANKERLRWLLRKQLLHPSIKEIATQILQERFVFPNDILEAIKADEVAWKNYQTFSSSYKRIRIAYIDAARKRPKEFQKRLANFIRKTKANKQIGYGGIEKFY
jgi:uncharacterized protein YdeI (YjbR/CyaY-like superfamily)